MCPGNPARQVSVLICCQDGQVAARVDRVLSGCKITAVTNAHEVVAAIEQGPFDVVLTGGDSPASEAVLLLRRIRAICPGIRVILKPRNSSHEELIAAMREGVFSYFSKPYFETAFDEILRHAASGADWQDSIRVESATPAWIRLLARCEIATADRVAQFLNEVSPCTGKDRESMGFAFKEILMNAMEYGGGFRRERFVEVSSVVGKRMLLYRIRDPGEGFSFEQLNHAAVSNPPEEPVRHLEVRDEMGIRPGGFGVLLSQKLVDDLIYSEQGSDVLLIKYLDDQIVESTESAASPE